MEQDGEKGRKREEKTMKQVMDNHVVTEQTVKHGGGSKKR